MWGLGSGHGFGDLLRQSCGCAPVAASPSGEAVRGSVFTRDCQRAGGGLQCSAAALSRHTSTL